MTTLTYTVEEAAEQLRIGRTTLYRVLSAGDLPSIRIGRSRRITAAALAEYIDRLAFE